MRVADDAFLRKPECERVKDELLNDDFHNRIQ